MENLNTVSAERLDMRPIPFSELLGRSAEMAGKCEDFRIPEVSGRTFSFSEPDRVSFTDGCGERRSMPFSPFAMSQLFSKLMIPVTYMNRASSTGRSQLVEDNVNSWASDYGKPLLIRAFDGGVRGVLSEKYVPMDVPEVLEGLSSAIPVGEFDVKGWYMDEFFTHIRLIGRERLGTEDSDLFPGIMLTTSDVGKSSLSVSFCVWKQVCTNGLVIPERVGGLFRQKHMGVSGDAFKKALFERFQDMAIVFRDVSGRIDSLGRSHIDVAEGKDGYAVDRAMSFGLSEKSGKEAVQLLIDGTYGHSEWGLVNAVTQVAQKLSLPSRLAVEEAAGKALLLAA